MKLPYDAYKSENLAETNPRALGYRDAGKVREYGHNAVAIVHHNEAAVPGFVASNDGTVCCRVNRVADIHGNIDAGVELGCRTEAFQEAVIRRISFSTPAP